MVSRLLNIILIIAGLSVLFSGIREFDTAHNGIEIFRGLFWILVGSGGFSGGLRGLKDKE